MLSTSKVRKVNFEDEGAYTANLILCMLIVVEKYLSENSCVRFCHVRHNCVVSVTVGVHFISNKINYNVIKCCTLSF